MRSVRSARTTRRDRGVPQPLSQIPRIGLLSGGGTGTPERPIEMDGIVPTGVATVTLQFPLKNRRVRLLEAGA